MQHTDMKALNGSLCKQSNCYKYWVCKHMELSI